MNNKYTKFILWIAIGASLIFSGSTSYDIYVRGFFRDELPFIIITTLLICSPYIIMLLTLRKASHFETNQKIHFGFSLFLVIVGITLLYALTFILTSATASSIYMMFLIILQWLICIITIVIESIIAKRHIKNSKVNQRHMQSS